MKNIVIIFVSMFLYGTIVSSCGGGTGQTNAANASVVPSSQPSAPESVAVVEEVEEVVEQGIVQTALPIVYQLPDGSTRVLPHLDLSLKRHVIGIWSGGMCVGLKNGGRVRWSYAMEKRGSEFERLGPEWELPARGDGAKFASELTKFNQTVVTLREDGVNAEPWITDRQYGRYWTKTPVDDCAVSISSKIHCNSGWLYPSSISFKRFAAFRVVIDFSVMENEIKR